MIADFNWLESILSSPILMVLMVCSVATLAVVLERGHYLLWKLRGDAATALQQVLQHIRAGRIQEASWTCRSLAHPMGAVAVAVFDQIRATQATFEEKLQVALSEQKMLLERNLGFLGTMAAVAPLVGLLGTVWGIMRAFHDMAQSGSAAPSVVAAGVAEALITTAAGLVIAVPAVVLYNHFARRIQILLTVSENNVRQIRTIFHAEDTSPPASSGGKSHTVSGVVEREVDSRHTSIAAPARVK